MADGPSDGNNGGRPAMTQMEPTNPDENLGGVDSGGARNPTTSADEQYEQWRTQQVPNSPGDDPQPQRKRKGGEFLQSVERPTTRIEKEPFNGHDDGTCLSCPSADFFFPSINHNLEPKDYVLMYGAINHSYFDAYGPIYFNTALAATLFADAPLTGQRIGDNVTIASMKFPIGDPNDPLKEASIVDLNSDPAFPRQKKMYVKSSVSEEFIYGDPFNYADARAIISLPSTIQVNNTTAFGVDHNTNPKTKVVPLIASEDYAILARITFNTFIGNQNTAKYLPPFHRQPWGQDANDFRPYRDVFAKLFSSIYIFYKAYAAEWLTKNKQSDNPDDIQQLDTIGGAQLPGQITPEGKIESGLSNSKNVNIQPKSAVPHFAAVPVVSNQLVYGPWTNYPYKKRNQIFPYLQNDAQKGKAIENMICNTKVRVDTELNPWNLNGMFMLDNYVDIIINDELNYQMSMETGQITIPGIPAFALGDEFRDGGSTLHNYSIAFNYNGYGMNINRNGYATPASAANITSMSTQISSGRAETTYTLRTYTSKLSLYNKESADRFKRLAKDNMKARKENSKIAQMIANRAKQIEDLNFNSTFRDLLYRHDNWKRKTSASSPSEILVGSFSRFENFVHNKLSNEDAVTAVNRRPLSPTGLASFHRSQIGLYEPKEMARELDTAYSTKSFMSLDGFFSPVSFYPTPYNSTKHYVKYDTKFCPFCNGAKKYRKIRGDDESYVYCEYCEPRGKSLKSYSPKESLPPYILASGIKLAVRIGEDAQTPTILYEYVTDKSLVTNPKKYIEEFGKKNINLFNLNPIIVATGEFRNSNAPSGDFSGHSIEIVGRGYIPPKNSLRIVNNITSSEIMSPYSYDTNKHLKKYDASTGTFVDDPAFTGTYLAKDFADIDYEFHRTLKDVARLQNPSYQLLNQRFFSLRGPLVMHGWGYDMEGYPVPNASGDYINDGTHKPDAKGRPWRTTALNIEGSNNPNDESCGDIVIGNNQVWDSEKQTWSAPYKEMEFSKSWGQQPNHWPVGPVDLRWDEDRKVWTAPQPYKAVYIVLEEDMVLEQNSKTSYPARGFIDNAEYSKEPLPSGLRRVVFVKDYSGYTAPRGAKLYCRYNGETGFYDPISKPNIIASGVIQQGNQAFVYNTYAVPNNGVIQDVTRINVRFNNAINLEVKPNHKALFVYVDGGWNLMTVGRA